MPAVLAVCNNNGIVEAGEQCDDANLQSNDGCTNCTMDPIFLDFNTSDFNRHSIEFFDLDQVVFFAEPNAFSFNFTPADLVSYQNLAHSYY